MTNHPVHIVNEHGELNPTALIPFCDLGGNASAMGIKIAPFDVSFCNSFRPKIVRDQLCYTVDPNEYKNMIDSNSEYSLSLFISYNEDRQIEETDDFNEHFITVDTIGKAKPKCLFKLSIHLQTH